MEEYGEWFERLEHNIDKGGGVDSNLLICFKVNGLNPRESVHVDGKSSRLV